MTHDIRLGGCKREVANAIWSGRKGDHYVWEESSSEDSESSTSGVDLIFPADFVEKEPALMEMAAENKIRVLATQKRSIELARQGYVE